MTHKNVTVFVMLNKDNELQGASTNCVSKRVTFKGRKNSQYRGLEASRKELNGQPEKLSILNIDQNIQNNSEVSLVSSQAVREFLLLPWKQYQEASRVLKSRILDEIVTLGVSRH